MEAAQQQNTIQQPASLIRRLAAMLYDGFLLIGLYFLATALALPLNNGMAFSQAHYGFQLYLLCVTFAFFAWFWMHGGQTPGMKAWHIKLQTLDADSTLTTISWQVAAKRFLFALCSLLCLGLGFVSILFGPQGLAWHDRWTQTHVVYLKKPEMPKPS